MSELVRERKLNECIINLPQTQIQYIPSSPEGSEKMHTLQQLNSVPEINPHSLSSFLPHGFYGRFPTSFTHSLIHQ